MLTGKKIIIFGAGAAGKRAIDYFGSRNVHCFADNNRAGDFYCGKHVISFEELCKIADGYDIVIATAPRLSVNISAQLESANLDNYDYFQDLLSINDFESDPRLAKFHNIHKGQRCFLIGNGPSLKPKDLDVICQNNEISFGCNSIYKIFSKTKWRPDYYCVADPFYLCTHYEDALKSDVKIKLLINLDYAPKKIEKKIEDGFGDVYLFQGLSNVLDRINKQPPSFSLEPSRCVMILGSVMYAMIQWAAYMGFSEIFLLGVDSSYNESQFTEYGENTDQSHFEGHSYNEELSEFAAYGWGKDEAHRYMLNAYTRAENYSREHGFRIYNATRGGALEVFERVDFDGLF